ncbi:MAG: hydrogenase expression protein, partial [Acetomicrobium sp.]|nr:hydrogenase expression protein [Acetomicrobium sp.]
VEIAQERLRKAGIRCSVVGSVECEGLGAQDFMAKEELWRMLSL